MLRRALSFAALLLIGCTTANTNEGLVPVQDSGTGNSGNDASAGSSFPTCQACITNADCPAGGICAQFSGDIFCAPSCGKGGACSPDRACETLTTASGDQVDVCVPRTDVCGAPVGPGAPGADAGTGTPIGDATAIGADTGTPPPPPSDAGTTSPPPSTCNGLLGPSVTSTCYCDPSLHTCQPNGCYGGWYCDPTTSKCHAPPTSCGTTTGGTDAGTTTGSDAGVPSGPPGTVGANGGTVNYLRFAVVGDTRPPVINDTSGYPSAIINQIYTDLANQTPAIPFAVSTGDYVFATSTGTNAGPQFDMYLAARAKFPGMLFPAMGNHECTGATTSNCIAGSSDMPSNNYDDMMSKLFAPIGKTKPYYSVRIDAADGSWTAKFVFIAANAWDSTQASWLDSTLSQTTTYTFIMRHEPAAATTAPGVSPSEQIMANHPYTLAIVGHTHTYGQTGSQQVTIGNGGAPLTGTATYGYGVVARRATDGAVTVDMYDYQTNQPDTSFHFALNPDGSAAAP